ncbi:MAG: inner-membrane translocator [Desulfobulbaceae bacterium]|nr:inner-membrane translocator [Desulfobulbaceae bacterium]
MKTVKEKITLVVLIVIYLLCSMRYFPGRSVDTLIETLKHILSVAPYNIGVTLLAVTVYRKLLGERLPWDRVARIFLTAGIVLEFFFGLYHYLGTGS